MACSKPCRSSIKRAACSTTLAKAAMDPKNFSYRQGCSSIGRIASTSPTPTTAVCRSFVIPFPRGRAAGAHNEKDTTYSRPAHCSNRSSIRADHFGRGSTRRTRSLPQRHFARKRRDGFRLSLLPRAAWRHAFPHTSVEPAAVGADLLAIHKFYVSPDGRSAYVGKLQQALFELP